MSGPSDIAELVRSYVPDGDERSHGVALEALATGRPMWPRSEFQPGHFTASGFVASPDGNSLLLIEHRKLRRWLQPGGHIDPGDPSVEEAARREIAEETGIGMLQRIGRSLVRIDAHPIPKRKDEPEHVHIDLAFGFRSATDAIGPIDEVLDARWVPFGDLETFDADEAMILAVRRLKEYLE